uniref:Uncharacterized protein n=1 Tax=Arundo donax TaxID=35708 RepID=A0A0A9GB55_ARUDO
MCFACQVLCCEVPAASEIACAIAVPFYRKQERSYPTRHNVQQGAQKNVGNCNCRRSARIGGEHRTRDIASTKGKPKDSTPAATPPHVEVSRELQSAGGQYRKENKSVVPATYAME